MYTITDSYLRERLAHRHPCPGRVSGFLQGPEQRSLDPKIESIILEKYEGMFLTPKGATLNSIAPNGLLKASFARSPSLTGTAQYPEARSKVVK